MTRPPPVVGARARPRGYTWIAMIVLSQSDPAALREGATDDTIVSTLAARL